MSLNADVWEREYRNPLLLTLGGKPRTDLVVFLRYLRKQKFLNEGWVALDLGSGTGRNSLYLASKGMKVTGFELSQAALDIAKENAEKANEKIVFKKQNIGEAYPLENASQDLVLDIMSSNSLNEGERDIYLKEVSRVLKKEGYFFMRALAKEGDQNAKELIKMFPGREKDTYVMPGMGLTERVFSEEDFKELYGKYFTIIKLERVSHYAQYNNRSYKRFYWVAYLQHD